MQAFTKNGTGCCTRKRKLSRIEFLEIYADNTTLMAESEELKSLLMKVKEQRGKIG